MGNLADYGYICDALADKKGREIVGIRLGEMSGLSDVFILVTGNSEPHMKTLVEAAQKVMERRGLVARLEGENSSNWRLLDGGDVAVHVFSRRGRDFYKIEKLWGDAETLNYQWVVDSD
ncbi:MAG: ribosome silencing factor [Synergistaceae bacterium]|jgi:ribosome-associated protein|nr:ribosome silencing factor [Synergistaceae bacterium]